MPIEIKEMHIKINVNEGSTSSSSDSSNDQNSIVQECMDHVAKLLDDKNER